MAKEKTTKEAALKPNQAVSIDTNVTVQQALEHVARQLDPNLPENKQREFR